MLLLVNSGLTLWAVRCADSISFAACLLNWRVDSCMRWTRYMKLYQYGPALVLLKMLILSSYRPDCLFFLLRKLTFCLFRNARTLNLDLHGLIVLGGIGRQNFTFLSCMNTRPHSSGSSVTLEMFLTQQVRRR